jgi:hypothetical protein
MPARNTLRVVKVFLIMDCDYVCKCLDSTVERIALCLRDRKPMEDSGVKPGNDLGMCTT